MSIEPRMRLLHIIRSADPRNGGPIEGVQRLAAVNARHGFRTEILSLDDPHAPFVARFPLPLHAVGPGIGNYGYTPRHAAWLRARHADYDAFVVNGVWQYHSLAARRVLRAAGRRYFLFTHGMLDPWFKREYPLKHLKKSLYWRWGEYPVLRDAAGVIFTCRQERELARQSFRPYRCREIVNPYGTADPPPPSDGPSALLGAHPELRGGRPPLVFLGRLHEKKGCDLAIEAFARVAAEHPDLRLVIAGPGEARYVERLKALAARLGVGHRISWTGMLQGDDKWRCLRLADAFILPSHQENFGIAVAEALACGVPVLISNQVNIWEEIERGGAGLVADDDLAGTEANLRRWLALDPAAKAAMRAATRDCFEANFHIDAAAAGLREILKADHAAKDVAA